MTDDYNVLLTGLRPAPSRWAVLDVIRCQFPYTVIRGEWPHGRIVTVTQTKWGARRAIRRDARKPQPPYETSIRPVKVAL